jgi:hypothetical protein
MATSTTLQVLIDIKSKLDGLEQAVSQMRQLRNETENAAKAGQGGFANLFKLGESVDLTRRLNDAISEVPRKLFDWTVEGVRFNALMEQSRIAIASALRQFDAANFPNFHAGLAKSGELIDLLREKANQFGLNFESVLHQYQASAAALFSAGVKDLQKQVDLTILLQRALATLPLAEVQKQRDIIDILSGQAKRTEAGRVLNIDDQALERAKESGQFVQELTRQLQGFLEAGDASANTFNATLNRLSNSILYLKGVATADATGGLKRAFDELVKILGSPQVIGTLVAVGQVITKLVEIGGNFARSFVPEIQSAGNAIAILNAGIELENKGELQGGVQIAQIAAAEELVRQENERVRALILQADGIRVLQHLDQERLAAAFTRKDLDVANAELLKTIADKESLRKTILAEITRLKADESQEGRNLVAALSTAAAELDKTKAPAQALAQTLAVAGGILKSMGAEADNLGNKIAEAVAKVNRELNIASALGPAGKLQVLQVANVDDLNRASQLAREITGQQQLQFQNVSQLGEFIRSLDRPDTTALVGPKTKANVEEVIKLYEQLGHTQLQITATTKEENAERKRIADNLKDFGFAQRQAEIDAAKFRGEDVTAAQHALDIDQKRVEFTDAYRTALEAGRITQDEVNTLADRQVAIDEQDKQLTIDKKNAKLAERDAHRDILTFLREESNLLHGVRQEQQLISSNPFLTVDQKNGLLLEKMREEITLINEKITEGQKKLGGGTLDPATYEQVARAVQDASFKVQELSQKTSTLSFGGNLKADLLNWVNSFGTAADQIGHAITDTIGTAIDGVANALTDVIFRTGNWKQTMLNVEKAIVGSLIKIGLQMIVNKVLGSLLHKEATAEQTANNATVLATATPAAVAQSGASFGANWVIAGIAAAAAIALIIGLLAGGFEKGGYTGRGSPKRIAGVVHGQEFVHPKWVVDMYGLQFMEAMRLGRIDPAKVQDLVAGLNLSVTARAGSFDGGGLVTGSGGLGGDTFGFGNDPVATSALAAVDSNDALDSLSTSRHRIPVGQFSDSSEISVEIFHFTDPVKMARAITNSDAGVKGIIDAVNGNFHLIKKRS